VKRLEYFLAVGVQPLLVQLGVELHDVGERRQAAVVHVGRGPRDAAQAGHAELAEVAVLDLHVPRLHRGRARAVVVVAAEQVERVLLQLLDARLPAGSTFPGATKNGTPVSANSPLVNCGRSGTRCSCPCRRRS
jgi:hypothetical protein